MLTLFNEPSNHSSFCPVGVFIQKPTVILGEKVDGIFFFFLTTSG